MQVVEYRGGPRKSLNDNAGCQAGSFTSGAFSTLCVTPVICEIECVRFSKNLMTRNIFNKPNPLLHIFVASVQLFIVERSFVVWSCLYLLSEQCAGNYFFPPTSFRCSRINFPFALARSNRTEKTSINLGFFNKEIFSTEIIYSAWECDLSRMFRAQNN